MRKVSCNHRSGASYIHFPPHSRAICEDKSEIIRCTGSNRMCFPLPSLPRNKGRLILRNVVTFNILRFLIRIRSEREKAVRGCYRQRHSEKNYHVVC
jgi:hypothetical protein